MRRLIAFLSTISIFAAMAACTPEENTNSKELTVTGTAMDIGITTVKITAYANLPIELGDAVFGVVCSENPSPSNKNGIMVQATRTDVNNMYSVTINGLSPNTKYYYASFVKNGRVYQYGEVKSFTTQDISASVSTEAATGIRLFEATISGKLTVESRDVPRSVWFLYSTSAESLEELKSSGTRADAHIGNDGAFFTYVLSSPNYNTTYYYVACAKVHNNEYYGEVIKVLPKENQDYFYGYYDFDTYEYSFDLEYSINLTSDKGIRCRYIDYFEYNDLNIAILNEEGYLEKVDTQLYAIGNESSSYSTSSTNILNL